MAALPRARDALGVPVVPPSWVTRAATAVRGRLHRTEGRMALPFQLVLDRLFGILDNKLLFVAVDLGLPDLLATGPKTAAELAKESGADADAVDRVLGFLVTRGLFERARGGRYANSAATDVLRRDHPWSWRDWVLFFGSDWNWEIWNQTPNRVRTGLSASKAAFGCEFFTYLGERNVGAGEAFNGAQACGSRMQALLFAEHYDLSDVRHICDVGGGTGSMVATILQRNPAMRGTVFDLPSLGDGARATLDSAGVAARASFVGGSFFDSVPEGCDLYTFFAIIHDWGDDDCVRILQNTRRAMPPDGRAVVVEGHLRETSAPDFIRSSDMLMLVLGEGGRERSLADFDALFARAGMRMSRRITLPSLFDAFELRADVPLGGSAAVGMAT